MTIAKAGGTRVARAPDDRQEGSLPDRTACVGTILILAAGRSSRMRGTDKLLLPVDGQPLLARVARRAIATGWRVLVVLPAGNLRRWQCLDGLDLTPVIVGDTSEGMAASVRAGVAAAGDVPGLMILPADMPDLDTGDMMTLIDAHRARPGSIHRGTAEGQPGHPVIFPAALLAQLLQLTGDTGARQVIRDHDHLVEYHPLPGNHATTDLDTPEAWARWQADLGPDHARDAGKETPA
ncbi:nucleotidyltransferase family protein [Paracoccus pacificus]|uniref:NTP transferase domain-containing protein n=1 Tax=Paracoccus pacificus TaxID=1463598 RepID=A0ABW4RAR8_9RHOB